MFYKLLIERALRSALAAFLSTLAIVASSPNVSLATTKAGFIAAGAAAVSAVVTLLSQAVGDPTSTSFLRKASGADQ